jgi:hypothetical protein
MKLRSLMVLVSAFVVACAPEDTRLDMRAPGGDVQLSSDQAGAVEAAYEERVRIGLGSPFRVMEIAAHDERLPAKDREDLLERLFERIENGDTYEIGPTLPLAHYRLIESAMKSRGEPRATELAINLAYNVAVRERTVTPELRYAAASTAALLRDRMYAQRDARHFAHTARTHDQAAHVLVPAMRATRQMSVEQPAMAAMTTAEEAEANRLAGMLIGGIRQAARTSPGITERRETTKLSADQAETIARLRTDELPQPALIVALRAAQLPFHAETEEQFVAELARSNADTRLAAQRAAIALRAVSQEHVWHEGVASPTAADIFAAYGVRIAFDHAVPAAWHSYFRFRLSNALQDLQLAMPGVNLKGLTIEVGDIANEANHLAFHDPVRRMIRWSPRTSGGSLAHEIAHDLDWQIARRAHKRSGYASDIATDVAAMMLYLRGDTVDERPTETFARQLDWMVASALAAHGVTNSELTSVQSDWLPGHGAARPPAADAQAANAIVRIAARGGRLDQHAQDALMRAAMAPQVPAAVHEARRTRQLTHLAAGPRVATPWWQLIGAERAMQHATMGLCSCSTSASKRGLY